MMGVGFGVLDCFLVLLGDDGWDDSVTAVFFGLGLIPAAVLVVFAL